MGRSIRIKILFAFFLICYSGYPQLITNYLHEILYTDSFLPTTYSSNRIYSRYNYANYFSSYSENHELKVNNSAFVAGANYRVNNLSIYFDYSKPVFNQFYENKSDNYSINRKFSEYFYRISTVYNLFRSTSIEFSYEEIDQSAYQVGAKHKLAGYHFGFAFQKSNRFVNLEANGNSITNKLIIPLGFSEIKASLSKNGLQIDYRNKAFDQTISRGSRSYLNAGRELAFHLKSEIYCFEASIIDHNYSYSAKQDDKLFLKLGKLNNQQIDISKSVEFRNWKFKFYYQHVKSELVATDNFIDAWPFNAFDFLTSDRLRINTFNSKLSTIGFSSQHHFHLRHFQITGLFVYEHYFYSGTTDYSRRYYIVFPIITSYNYFSENFKSDIDGAVQIGIELTYDFSDFEIILNVNQFIPINYNKINLKSSNSTVTNSGQSGGFKLMTGLNYYF